MGFQVVIDFLGASILGGTFLLTLLQFQAQNLQAKQQSHDDIVAQQNLMSLVNILEEDFRRIGYCADRANMTGPVVLCAGTDYIAFRTDLVTDENPEGDGEVDSVAYMLGPLQTMSANPRERMLYRRENDGQWQLSSLGVTHLEFRYHKYNDDTLSRPVATGRLREITGIEVILRVENQFPFVVPETVDSLNIVSVNWRQLDFELKNFGRGGS
ncbi:MAG: hypothetical protein AB1428_08910 [Bacteroidota bacterium]